MDEKCVPGLYPFLSSGGGRKHSTHLLLTIASYAGSVEAYLSSVCVLYMRHITFVSYRLYTLCLERMSDCGEVLVMVIHVTITEADFPVEWGICDLHVYLCFGNFMNVSLFLNEFFIFDLSSF